MKRQMIVKAVLVFASLAFTMLVFMNTYEVVFNKDIPLANSVSKFVAQDEIQAIIGQFDIKPEQNQLETNAEYLHLQYLQIPAISSNLYLEEKRVINGYWYVRPSLGHYIGLDKDSHGVTLDYLIYADSGWRTLPDPNQIEVGMDVNLFHDDNKWAGYKVTEKQVLPFHAIFIPSKAQQRQIVLLIDDSAHGVYYGYSLVEKA